MSKIYHCDECGAETKPYRMLCMTCNQINYIAEEKK